MLVVHASANRKPSSYGMRQVVVIVVLVLALVAAFVGRSSAVPTTATDSEDITLSKLVAPDTSSRSHFVTESKNYTSIRFLRTSDKSAIVDEPVTKYDEKRDISAATVIGMSVKAIRMKAKLNVMLARGLSPTRVLEKLKVARLTDKNFNNFARYYAKYLAKYSNKVPNLTATAEDVIVLPKLKEWLGQKLFPSQVKQNLKDIASRDVNRYIQLYIKDADNAIILPKLEAWLGQKILPSQVKYNLNEIGVTDTSKYVEWYMRNGGDAVVTTKLQDWLAKRVFPPQIVQKLGKIGVTDIEKYPKKYMAMWGKRQAELTRRNIN